jgi:hypothetical protein
MNLFGIIYLDGPGEAVWEVWTWAIANTATVLVGISYVTWVAWK